MSRTYYIEWPHQHPDTEPRVWYDATGPGRPEGPPELKPVGGWEMEPTVAVWSGSLYAAELVGFATRATNWNGREEPRNDRVTFYPASPRATPRQFMATPSDGRERAFIPVDVTDTLGRTFTRRELVKAWGR